MADTIAIRLALLEISRILGDLKTVGATGDKEVRRIGQAAEHSAERTRSLRAAIGGVGLQLQDVAVQLQSGTSIFTVIAQQAPQALSAFGGLGIAIGTVTALVAVAAGAFFGLGKDVDAAKEAVDKMKASQDAFSGILPASINNIDELREAYRKLTAAQKDAAGVALGTQATELQRAITEELAKVQRAFGELGGEGRLRAIQGRVGLIDTFQGATGGDAGAALAREREALQREREQLLAARRLVADLAVNNANSSAQTDLQSLLSGGDDKLQKFATAANEASGKIADLAKQLQVLNEKQRELDQPGTADPGILGGSPEAKKRLEDEERERVASLRRVATEQRRIERELLAERKRDYQASVQLLVGQAEAGMFDDGRSPAARERGARVIEELRREDERRAQEVERDLQRQAERQADILVRPLQDAAQAGTQAFTEMYRQILDGGRVSAGELAASFADALTASVSQIPGLLLSIPLSAGIKSLTDQMAAEIARGGSGLGAFAGSAFGAGSLGLSAGMLGSSLYGGNQTGSAIGGLAGAGLGFLIGGPIGAALGGFGGGLVGGMFGGGGGNNRAGSALQLGTGLLFQGSDAKSGQNQSAANSLLQNLQQTQQLLLRAGASFEDQKFRVSIGDKSGYQLFANDNEKKFSSLAGLQRGALNELLASGTGYSSTLQTVITNTKGQRAEVIADALAFATAFDRMSSPAGALIEQLRDLNMQFDQASARARSYGLDVAAVEEARTEATRELLESAESALTSRAQQIRGAFDALLDPIRQTLTGINIGGLSALSPAAQLDLARGQFQSLAGKALSGDERSIQQLSGAGQTFLQQARQFGASGETFQAAFREVNTALSQVLATGEARQESILSALPDAIRDANTDTIVVLQKGFGEMVDQVALLRAEIARVRPAAA